MDAISYLKQAREIEIKINQKRQELEAMKRDAIGSSGRKMEKIVTGYVDLEEKLEHDLFDLHKSRVAVIDTIHKLDDSLCLIVLHAKWIDGQSLEQIAATTDYSFPYIRKKYWKGMRGIKEILKESK